MREVEPSTPIDEVRANEDFARIARLVERVQKAGLFGRVVFGFQAGKVVSAQIEQTLKAEEM